MILLPSSLPPAACIGELSLYLSLLSRLPLFHCPAAVQNLINSMFEVRGRGREGQYYGIVLCYVLQENLTNFDFSFLINFHLVKVATDTSKMIIVCNTITISGEKGDGRFVVVKPVL